MHKLLRLGLGQSPFDFFLSCILFSEKQVIFYGSGEQEGLLTHVPDLPSQPLQVDVSEVDSIQVHISFVRVVVSENELHYGALSAPDFPTKAECCPSMQMFKLLKMRKSGSFGYEKKTSSKVITPVNV